MRNMLVCAFLAFAIALIVPVHAVADIEAPVRIEALDLTDLGNFHGEIATNNELGWGYWGAREPIVTDDWVVFPVGGIWSFIIESRSHQFVPEDTDDGIFAEIDLRARVEGENGVRDVAEVLLEQQDGELLVLHTRIKADADLDEWFTEPLPAGTVDPPGAEIQDDRTTGVIEFDAGMKAQFAVWFTNDEWQPDPPPAKDRNMRLRALEFIAPEGSLAVEARGKLATQWGALKSR